METIELSDMRVRRMLTCLSDFKRRSLKEVTDLYNKRYPPALRFFGKKQDELKRVLDVLMLHSLVSAEIFTFTNEPIPPTKFYELTMAGFHMIRSRH